MATTKPRCKREKLPFELSKGAAWLVSIALAGAGAPSLAEPLRASDQLPHVAEMGYLPPGPGSAAWQTYSTIGGARRDPASGCAVASAVEVPLADAGWLQLTAVLRPEDEAGVAEWLQRPAAEGAVRSHADLLGQLVRSVAVGIDALASPRGRPSRMTFQLHLVPTGCAAERLIATSGEEARKSLRMPILVQAPAMLGDYAHPGLLQWLMGAIAHELAHVLQLMPFDRARAAWALGGQRLGTDQNTHVSVKLEVGAMLIEQCLIEAIAPLPLSDRPLARLWANDRPQLRALTRETPGLALYGKVFQVQEGVLGRGFVGHDPAPRLAELWGLCWRAAHTPDRVLSQVPLTRAERQAGAQALAAVRALGPPNLRPGPPAAPPR